MMKKIFKLSLFLGISFSILMLYGCNSQFIKKESHTPIIIGKHRFVTINEQELIKFYHLENTVPAVSGLCKQYDLSGHKPFNQVLICSSPPGNSIWQISLISKDTKFNDFKLLIPSLQAVYGKPDYHHSYKKRTRFSLGPHKNYIEKLGWSVSKNIEITLKYNSYSILYSGLTLSYINTKLTNQYLALSNKLENKQQAIYYAKEQKKAQQLVKNLDLPRMLKNQHRLLVKSAKKAEALCISNKIKIPRYMSMSQIIKMNAYPLRYNYANGIATNIQLADIPQYPTQKSIEAAIAGIGLQKQFLEQYATSWLKYKINKREWEYLTQQQEQLNSNSLVGPISIKNTPLLIISFSKMKCDFV